MTFVKVSFLACIGSVLTACAGVTVPDHLAKPADPNARVPSVRYRSVTADASTYRPANPKNWQELNRNVGPRS